MDTIILMTLVVIAILIILIIKEYNKIIKLQNKVKSSESGIDIYLNQRFDLIPNLVECVKGYAKHEKQLLENITKQRTEYAKNQNLKKAGELNKKCPITVQMRSRLHESENCKMRQSQELVLRESGRGF